MSLTDLPNPNSGTDAVTLRDGRQLLVYNHNLRTGSNNKGRSPLNVAISGTGILPVSSQSATETHKLEACATADWRSVLKLENNPDAPSGFAYPAVIQTHDGLVHITYTWERKRIKHVVIDPKFLTANPR